MYLYLLYALLLVCFVAMLACFIERYMRLNLIEKEGKWLLSLLKPLLREKNWKEAGHICEQHSGVFGQVVQTGLLQQTQGLKRVQESLEEESRRRMIRAQGPIQLLYMFGQIAPLMGLLIALLASVELFANALPIEEMGLKLQHALLGAACGCVIAIPSIIGYHLLMLRAERCTLVIEQLTEEAYREICQERVE